MIRTCTGPRPTSERPGGIGASRVFTRIWLALFGKWPWERLPVMPPELMLLPPSIPLNIYDFACWARQTVVALTVISAHRPVRDLSIDIAELDVGPAPDQRRSLTSWAGRFDLLDRFLHVYERRPLAALRRFSLGRGRALDHHAARRRTVRGAGSSPHGSTRSWLCTSRATPLTTR